MKVVICTDKISWEKSSIPLNQAEFLQSWDWGVFQRSVGNMPLRMQLFDKDTLVWQGQGFVYSLALGKMFVYFPRVFMKKQYLAVVCQWLKKQGYVFVRFEPIESGAIPQDSWHVEMTTYRQPKDTLLLDLSQTQDELFAHMHSKTRYNIRLAEKKGVEIRREPSAEVFYVLNTQTTSRDNFRSHEKAYYEKMLAQDMCEQFTAYYEGVPIASNICVYGSQSYVYLHGASSNEHRNVMAPYLLQWVQIQHAKQLGLATYDFWGISPSTPARPQTSFHHLSWNVDDVWTGVTRFKAGFGGFQACYADAFEVMLSGVWYRLYKFVSALRK